jgi:Protein of unknown function (DUF3237)
MPSASASAPTGPGAEDATWVPDASWACGMPEGIPEPTKGELVFIATLELGDTHEFGTTQYGDRRLLDVTGGSFTGERLEGEVITGGLDLELALTNGTVEVEQIDILRTDDGALVLMRSCGIATADGSTARVIPDFEVANNSAYAWLNDGEFAATRVVDAAQGTVELRVYDISAVDAGDTLIEFEDPVGVPNQPWNCSTETGQRGDSVFTENVTLGSSLSVGASKRGTRNIIPITGGTVSGGFQGTVLPGGADYQILSGNAVLDARYTLRNTAGDYVLVRNCGPIGALIPQFEAAVDGDLAFLNANTFLSSDPGTGGGGVSITFYERQ